jgi:hypothetical protein
MIFYWDYDNQKLMDALNSGQQIQRMTMVLRDQVDITLYVMRLNTLTEQYELVDYPAGKAPLFGLKGTTQPKLEGEYLAAQSIWTKTATGTYEGTVDLAIDELKTEMGTAISVALKAEFCLRDVDGKDHYSSQFDVTMNYDVNGGSEGATHPLAFGCISLTRSEVIDGVTRTLILLADGTEVACFPPREV